MSDIADKLMADPPASAPQQTRHAHKNGRKPVLSARGTSEAPPDEVPVSLQHRWRVMTTAVDRGLKLAPVTLRAQAPKPPSEGTGRSGSVVYTNRDDAMRRKKVIQTVA